MPAIFTTSIHKQFANAFCVEIVLWQLTTKSEYEYETSRFSSMPKLKNFLNHKAKIIIEISWHFETKIYKLKKGLSSFSVKILEQ